MNKSETVGRYVNACPDGQMHESVTYRCSVCGKPFHKETDGGGLATCSGHLVYEVMSDGSHVAQQDSRHESAPLRQLVR